MKIIGTAGSKPGMDLVASLGCDLVLNHRETDYLDKLKAESFAAEGVDLVLEMMANVNLDNDMKILKWKKGRVVV